MKSVSYHLIIFSISLFFIRCAAYGSDISIGNKQFNVTFEKDSGYLTGITNKISNKEYIKDKSPTDFPFRIQVEGSLLDKKKLKLFLVSAKQENNARRTLLKYDFTDLNVILEIVVPEKGCMGIWKLKVINKSNLERKINISFPCLTGINIGKDKNSDMVAGTGDGVGYVVSVAEAEKSDFELSGDRWYGGSNVTMQWRDIYNIAANSGLGVIVKDDNFLPKVLENTQTGYQVRYMEYSLSPDSEKVFPPTEVMIHTGDWHLTADEYRSWFKSKFKFTLSPKWFVEDKYSILGIDKGNRNRRIDEGTDPETSYCALIKDYYDLPAVLDEVRATGSSVVEITAYQESWPLHHIANDGDYKLRDDLGGPEAFKEGIKRIHERGGKVILYIEGLLTWKGSKIGQSRDAEKWAIRKPDGTLSEWYLDRWHECVSEKGWQDYLVNKCVKFVRDYDVDGIRLDSLGATGFNPCYNKEHKHYPDPYTWGRGLLELVSRVKSEMTKIKPDAVLLVEGPVDYLYQWVDGSLAGPISDETIMKYTFPEIYLSPILSSGWGLKSPSMSLINGYPWMQWGHSRYKARSMFNNKLGAGLL